MQPTGLTSSNPRSIESTVSYENSGEQRSTAVVRKVLESSHRVSKKDLETHVHTMKLFNAYTPFARKLKPDSQIPKSDANASAMAYKFLIQNEKRCLPEPPSILYKLEPDLYSTEFGTYLLQSAGYDETTLTQECGKYISIGEYATFLDMETTCTSHPLLSVLIVKRSLGYGVAYFRESRMCQAYCQTQGIRSSQIRDRTQSQSITFFGRTKYDDLETHQKPLVLSFQNPDRTSTCFTTFTAENVFSKEYIEGEGALSHKIDTLLNTQGTYLYFTNEDLNVICPLNEIPPHESTLDTTPLTIPEKARLQGLL